MEIGQNLNINNRHGIVCFKEQLNKIDYINVYFEDNNEYITYKITKDGNDYLLEKELDKNTLSSLLAIWVNEELIQETSE